MSVSIMDEVLGADFGDKRLDKRLGTIAEEFDSHPNVSIPAATTGRAEMEAAYRFFDNDKVTPDKILEPHFQATRKRIAEHDVVLVEAANPPAGCEPIQWLLITTMPIDTAEQVQAIVSAYCIRWQIEIFFKTLKTGCRVEQRQFETIDRILNCLAVYSIVAWRIMHLCRLGRECPDLDCEVVFEPCEWKAVYTAIKREDPPQTPPRLNEMIRLVASLGGYVIRKSTQPGPQTLWIGLQRVHDLSTAWEAFGPDS